MRKEFLGFSAEEAISGNNYKGGEGEASSFPATCTIINMRVQTAFAIKLKNSRIYGANVAFLAI